MYQQLKIMLLKNQVVYSVILKRYYSLEHFKEVPFWVLPSCGWLMLLHRCHLGVSVSVFSICSNCDLTINAFFIYISEFVYMNLFIYVYLYFNNLYVWEKIYNLNGKIWLSRTHTMMEMTEWSVLSVQNASNASGGSLRYFFSIVLISRYPECYALNRAKCIFFNYYFSIEWTVQGNLN